MPPPLPLRPSPCEPFPEAICTRDRCSCRGRSTRWPHAARPRPRRSPARRARTSGGRTRRASLAPGAEVMEQTHREQPHVQVGERHPEQAGPGPLHVMGVQGGRSAPDPVPEDARSAAREAVQPPPDEMTEGMAAERVACKQGRIDQEDDAPDPDPETAVAEERAEGVVI